MGRFDGILICTDLDGTLLKNNKELSKENLDAIQYFKAEGGLFTFVTGRMPFFVSYILDGVKPNLPFGCVNGGGLFDASKGDYIWKCTLPFGFNGLIKCVDENFPNVGIQVNTFYKTYFCKENITMERFRETTGLENLVCPYDKVTEPVAKVLFGVEDPDDIPKMHRMLLEMPEAKNYSFTRSSLHLFEIIPKDIDKGTSITMLCRLLGIDINKTLAVGDYNNDVNMLKTAKIGVAVANACLQAKEAADFVTVSNEENAISRIIYDIEKGIYKF